MNIALFAKWLWRFGAHKNAVWWRLIAAKYEEDRLGWSSRMSVGLVGCGVWKGIMLVEEEFFELVKFKVNKDKHRGFSISSMYDTLCHQIHDVSPGICVWNSLIQLKVSFLLWRLWWNRVPTIDNLIRRGMGITNWCCLCISASESSGHLFHHCPWISYLWNYFLD